HEELGMSIPLLVLIFSPLAPIAEPAFTDSLPASTAIEVEATVVPAPAPAPDAEPTVELVEVSERELAATAARQSASGFLYQVLLAAVTALITALIWKAIT